MEGRESNYESILVHDIVFFGPSSESSFTYNGKTFVIIQLVKEISIKELFMKLPKDWYPELVIVETPVMNYVHDFFKCPVPTLCFSRDAWGEMIYNHNIAKLFDFVAYQTIDINAYNPQEVNLIHDFGGPISIPNKVQKNIKFKNRNIDILAIASYDRGLYHERYKLFCNIAKQLGNSYKIKILNGIRYDKIHKYYKRSKIVLDWSNVLSCRSYEAIVNGCLFFSLENNILISSVWKKDKEFIPFNEKTVVNKLKYYLENEEEAQLIISNARKKYDEMPQSTGKKKVILFKKCLKGFKKDGVEKRKIETMSESEIIGATATTLYFNYQYIGHNHPDNWKELYFERIERSLNLPGSQLEKKRQLLEAVRMAYLLRNEKKFDEFETRIKDDGIPNPWLNLLRAKIEFRSNATKSWASVKNALSEYDNNPIRVRQEVLPFIEKGDNCDARRVLDYMWQSVYQHQNEFQGQAFLCEAYTLLGKLCEKKGNIDEAIRWYSLSIDQISIPENGLYLCKLLVKKEMYDKLRLISKNVLSENPYDVMSALYLAYAYLKLNVKSEAKEVLREQYRILRVFTVKSKITNKINLSKIVIAGMSIIVVLPRLVSVAVLGETIPMMEKVLS